MKFISKKNLSTLWASVTDYVNKRFTDQEKAKLATFNPLVTLSAAPTTATKTYTDSYGTHSFAVGDRVRVKDGNSSYGYTFYTLYDIDSGGNAVWGMDVSGLSLLIDADGNLYTTSDGTVLLYE